MYMSIPRNYMTFRFQLYMTRCSVNFSTYQIVYSHCRYTFVCRHGTVIFSYARSKIDISSVNNDHRGLNSVMVLHTHKDILNQPDDNETAAEFAASNEHG
jgi:hypothetical protein